MQKEREVLDALQQQEVIDYLTKCAKEHYRVSQNMKFRNDFLFLIQCEAREAVINLAEYLRFNPGEGT